MSTLRIQSARSAAFDAQASWEKSRSSAHSVQIYEDDDFLLDGLSRFTGAALLAGDSALIIATRPHTEELARRLTRRGLDLTPAIQQGRYLSLDASETLSRFMVGGRPDPAKFLRVVGAVIAQLSSAARPEHP